MSTQAVLDEVHDYVDALLGSAIEPVAVVAPPAAPSVTAEVKPPAAPAARVTAAPTEVAASPRASTIPQTTHRWLRVAIGSDSYALELLCVQEVVRVAPIVAMRGANHAVLGVMNLRGRIVPVFDLGLWLGTACVQPDERSRIVVVEREDELIGVLVTLVEDVVTLAQHRIEPPLPGSARGPIVGVARVGATPTVLLDAGALFGG
ncbi:chemotaxis protein CheW [Lysobacter terrae]